MPELAEVEWYRKQWDAGLGQRVESVRLHGHKRLFRGTNTRTLRQCLSGQILLSSAARGKRMLFRFSAGNPGKSGARGNVRSWLGIHLGMTGALRVESANFTGDKHDHLILHQAKRTLVLRDPRQFGRVQFRHGVGEPDWWRTGVPDIMEDMFDRPWQDRFLQRHAKAAIKAVLLMQHGFPGIGNWMADEILWRAKILPARPVCSLGEFERSMLFRQTKFVVRRSLETLGEDYSDPPRGWLIHERWKRGGKCPKHGIGLSRATVGGRTTAWCSKCQR